MASVPRKNPQAEEDRALHSDVVAPMDIELQNVLYSPTDRIERVEIILRHTISSTLHARFPTRGKVLKRDASILSKFLLKVEKGIEMLGLANSSIHGDADAIAMQLSEGLSRLGEALDVQQEDAGEGTVNVVEDAIRDASSAIQALVAKFTAQSLSDNEMLPVLESPFSDKQLSPEAFFDIPEAKPPELVFRKPKGSHSIIANVLAQQSAPSAGVSENKDVPAFRWSWTDDELFLERKLPQMRVLKGKKQNFISTLELLKKPLLTRFYQYQSLSILQNPQYFVRFNAFKTSQDARIFFDNLKKEFIQHIDSCIAELQQMFASGMMLEKSWHSALSRKADELKYIFTQKKLPNPNFIEEELDKYIAQFNRLCKDEQYPLPTITSQHISSSHVLLFNRDSRLKAALKTEQIREVFKYELLIGCSRSDEGDMKDTMKKSLTGQYDVGKTSEQKRIMEKVGSCLIQELGKVDISNLEQESSPLEHIQTMKLGLTIVLQCIEQFQAPEAPPHLLGIMKNAASYHVCWNFRESILTDFVESRLSMNKNCIAEMNDFYPTPPEISAKSPVHIDGQTDQETTKPVISSDVLQTAWNKIGNTAISGLSIVRDDDSTDTNLLVPHFFTTQNDRVLDGILAKISQGTSCTHSQLNEYIAALKKIVESLPSAVKIGSDTVQVPSDFSTYLEAQIDSLASAALPFCEDVTQEKKSDPDALEGFVDPLAEIAARARARKNARKASAIQTKETLVDPPAPQPKPVSTEVNPIVSAALVVFDREEDDIQTEDICDALCKGFTQSISEIAKVFVSSISKESTKDDIEKFGNNLTSLTTAICTAFEVRLREHTGVSVPTPAHVASAVRWALRDSEVDWDTLGKSISDRLWADIEEIAIEVEESDEDGFLNFLSTSSSVEVATSEHTSGSKGILPDSIAVAVKGVIQAKASQEITAGLSDVRMLIAEARSLLGEGEIFEEIRKLEGKYLEGDSDALSRINTVMSVLRSSLNFLSHQTSPQSNES